MGAGKKRFLGIPCFRGNGIKYSIRDHLASGLIMHTFLLLICFDRHTKERPNRSGLYLEIFGLSKNFILLFPGISTTTPRMILVV